MILAKKDEILKLAQEGDDAMGLIHAALTTLPPLSDQVSDTELVIWVYEDTFDSHSEDHS